MDWTITEAAAAASVVLVTLSAVGTPAAAQPGTGLLRVSTMGSDTGNCGSAGSPCRNIQRAVNLAVSGDEIRVAAGTYVYQPSLDTACSANILATAVVCIINKELALRGGFDGSDWDHPSPDVYETVIDGQDSKRGILVTYVTGPAPAASLVLEGFTVTRGFGGPASGGIGDALLFGFGGGLQSVLSRTEIRSVLFINNRAAGADVQSSPEYGGAAGGGGVALQGAPAGSVLEDVRFVNNEARGGSGPQRGGYGIGGGIFTYHSTLIGARLRFEDNLASGGSSTGDGIQSNGELADGQGGGAAFHLGSDVTLTDVVAINNLAQGGGARNTTGGQAGWGFGGGLYAEGQASPPDDTHLTLTQVHLEGNRAAGGAAFRGGGSGGGGITSGGAGLTMDRAVLRANQSEGGDGNPSGGQRGAAGGGGAYLGRGSEPVQVLLTNCIISDNEVIEGATGAVSGGGGGGLWLQGLTATVRHCSFHDNRLNQPYQGIGIVLIENLTGASVVLEDSIVSGHTLAAGAAAIHVRSGSTLTLGPGLFSGNGDDTNDGDPESGLIVGLADMATVDTIGYRSAGAPNFDYHLTPESPAIDLDPMGNEALDFEGQARSGARDAGADEFGSPAAIFSDAFESGRPWAWALVVRP